MVEFAIERAVDVDDDLVAAWARLMPQLSLTAAAPTREELTALVASPGATLLIARLPAGGRIAGALTVTTYRLPTGLRAQIDDVVVDADLRGRGIAEALSRAAIAAARQAGARAIGLTSHPRREAANRLYLRLGFVPRETNVYSMQLDDLG